MKTIKKGIYLKTITLVIAGLFLASTFSVLAMNTIAEKKNTLKIEKITTEPHTFAMLKTELNLPLKHKPLRTASPLFTNPGDQYHPAFAQSDTGRYIYAYTDSDSGNIIWTYTADDGVYFNVGGDYPSLKLWSGTRFFGTLVPDVSDADGGSIYLFETTDPKNFDAYELSYWAWADNGWSNIRDIDIACDNSKETWEWGFVSLVSSTTYGDGVSEGPFISYPTSDDGYATMSWFLLDGCSHTDNVIDHASKKAYSVYDIINTQYTGENSGLFIRMDFFDDWDMEPVGYIYTPQDVNVRYPAVAAYDDHVVVVAQSESVGNNDLICFYGSSLDNLQISSIVATSDDELYPDVTHVNDYTFICTFVQNGNLYSTITEDAGATWSEPIQINDNTGAVKEDYKTSDLNENGVDALWTEDHEDLDIYSSIPIVLSIESISGGFGISAVVKNSGTEAVESVDWSIVTTGTVFLNGQKSGQITLQPGASTTIKTGVILGFGYISITVTVGEVTKKASGLLLLFYITQLT